MSQHPITDAGRHLSDAVREAHTRGAVGRWIAARLEDGRTDGMLYDSRGAAVRHTSNKPDDYAYLMVPPHEMPPAEATAWLDLHRRCYAAGMDLKDPGAVPVAPLSRPPAPRPSPVVLPNRAERRRYTRPWRKP